MSLKLATELALGDRIQLSGTPPTSLTVAEVLPSAVINPKGEKGHHVWVAERDQPVFCPEGTKLRVISADE